MIDSDYVEMMEDIQQEETEVGEETTNQVDILEDDFEFARQKLRDMVARGSDAFESMVEVARESEHPRAYEVLSGMMKNISDIAGSLVDLNKKKKETSMIGKNPRKEALPGGVTNNNVFVGSTQELQKMLQQQAEQAIDVETDDE